MVWNFRKRNTSHPSRAADAKTPLVDAASEWRRLEIEYPAPLHVFQNARDAGLSTQYMESILKSQHYQATTPSQAVRQSVQPLPPPSCDFTYCNAGGNAGSNPGMLLAERLRLVDTGIPPIKLRNVHIFVTSDKTTVIAFKGNSEHVIFEDETCMFPSDKLVAAFHLLIKAS